MPLNTLRLNQRQLHPNDRITFITALPGATHARAETFLKRIAAICYPIMKAHSLSITTLEEFPPNREFMGRNFNGGEVIQLVLRRMPSGPRGAAGRSSNVARLDHTASTYVSEDTDGGWLSLRSVQMVMMHELAHCKQMNHSKAFWAVRDEYAVHLRVLWERGYTGEGMWGRGQELASGEWGNGGGSGAGEFADLCGGTYRGRRKRKRATYAERKERKLRKTEEKFGKGQGVGGSEGEKMLLEGRYNAAKPRVANSKRGRELRAAAALARFETAKTVKEEEQSGTETESESEGEGLLDRSGKLVKDAEGNSLYRVKEEEDEDQKRHELDELLDLETSRGTKRRRSPPASTSAGDSPLPKGEAASTPPQLSSSIGDSRDLQSRGMTLGSTAEETAQTECNICTLLNPSSAKVCQACGMVLAPASKGTGDDSWSCSTKDCAQVGFINPADAGRCGLCGGSRGAS